MNLRNADGKPVTSLTIVRDGLTRHERLAIADRDPRMMARLYGFDENTRTEICRLCDKFKQQHGDR